MVDLKRNLATRLKKLRGERTQREFAKMIGISQPHLNRIEQAQENVTIRTLQKMTDRLRCGIGWLLGDGRGAPKK